MTDGEKELRVTNAGYRFDFRRASYVNVGAKRLLTVQFVEKASPDELRAALDRPAAEEWDIVTSEPISDAYRRAIMEGLEAK